MLIKVIICTILNDSECTYHIFLFPAQAVFFVFFIHMYAPVDLCSIHITINLALVKNGSNGYGIQYCIF